jgi:hypothetical protein
MTDHTCSRCGKTLFQPVEENANYVVHDDFVEEEDQEVHYAHKHTRDTEHAVAKVQLEQYRGSDEPQDFDSLASEMAHPEADEKRAITVGTERKEFDDGTFVETARQKEVPFSIPLEEFETEETDTPEAVKEDDVALVETKVEKRPVQKTGLVCRDCTKDSDEIIWGPDA